MLHVFLQPLQSLYLTLCCLTNSLRWKCWSCVPSLPVLALPSSSCRGWQNFLWWVTFGLGQLLQPADFLINFDEMKHLVGCACYRWGKHCCSFLDVVRFKLDGICERTTPERMEGTHSWFPCGCSQQLGHLIMVEIYTVQNVKQQCKNSAPSKADIQEAFFFLYFVMALSLKTNKKIQVHLLVS